MLAGAAFRIVGRSKPTTTVASQRIVQQLKSRVPIIIGSQIHDGLSCCFSSGSSTTTQQKLFIGSVRFMSSSNGKSSKDDKEEKKEEGSSSFISRTISGIITPRNQAYAAIAGGSLGAYLISKFFLNFTSFFTHLTPTVVAKYGFYTGFGCATFVGGIALVTLDNIYIRADPVYKYCLNWVSSDDQVRQALGEGLKAGHLRSYRLDAGKMELDGKQLVWRPPRIQMLFDVTATLGPPYRTGLVTCEAIKAGGFPPKLQTTLLKVDYETGNEGEVGTTLGNTFEGDQAIFLVGSNEDVERVSKRSGLSLAMLASQVHINKAAAETKK